MIATAALRLRWDVICTVVPRLDLERLLSDDAVDVMPKCLPLEPLLDSVPEPGTQPVVDGTW